MFTPNSNTPKTIGFINLKDGDGDSVKATIAITCPKLWAQLSANPEIFRAIVKTGTYSLFTNGEKKSSEKDYTKFLVV